MSDDKKTKLAQLLEALPSNDEKLERVLTALLKAAVATSDSESSTSSERPKPQNVEELVSLYQQKQLGMKKQKTGASSTGATSTISPSCSKSKQKGRTKMYCLNFARYRKTGLSYKKCSGNVQVSGFTDGDKYSEVVAKGAKGLDIKADPKSLSLVISNALVLDVLFSGNQPWTLGSYVEEFGGVSARGKKTFGIYVPPELEEGDEIIPMHTSTVKRKNENDDHAVAAKRKRQASPQLLTTSSLGTKKENPIEVDSEKSVTEFIDVGGEAITARYCPVKDGKVCTSIIATGRCGVWRILNFELDQCDGHVEKCVAEELPVMQPERDQFILVELSTESGIYLQANPLDGTSKELKDICYTTKDNLIHSSTTITKGAKETVYLLCISPDHGKVDYLWERNNYGTMWEEVPVPSHTCLLYIELAGTYRCHVGAETITYTVKDSENVNSTGLLVDYSEITIGTTIGKGGFGTVNKGKWKNQDVALKRMRLPGGCGEDLADMKEIAVLRQLNHPNIIPLLGYAKIEEEVILIMKYVDGQNLDHFLFGKKKREFGVGEERYIATKIAHAVQYMHHHDPVVIHQDIKPQNVLITNDLSGVFVCDMGVTKLKKAGEATVTSTSKGPGTFPYMAPEMFKKARRGPSVDIYSMGCLYVELFGKQRVWPGLDGTEIMLKVCGSYNTPPCSPNLSHLKVDYFNICHSCCQLDPTSRPTIDEVVYMLTHL